MSLLDLNLQHKTFRGAARPSLVGIRLQLVPGEIVGLLGPHGCGKSALLRILAGLDRAYDGRVELTGRRLTGPDPAVGVMFQEPRLLPWLDVAHNVAFGAPLDAARVAELLAEVGLSRQAGALPRQLSGGQAQRVALARALYARPRLLLLDEPFAALDASTRSRLQDLLLRLAVQHGSTLLLATHDVEEAAYLSDRVLVMSGDPGRIGSEHRLNWPRPRARDDGRLLRWQAALRDSLQGVPA